MIITENIKETVSNSNTVYEIMLKIYQARPPEEQHKEYMYVIGLNNNNNILFIDLNGIGTLNHCSIYIRELLRIALIKNAASVILVHNHPGGTNTPSNEDKRLTESTKEAAKLLEIRVIDHIIITEENGYSSFSDLGII